MWLGLHHTVNNEWMNEWMNGWMVCAELRHGETSNILMMA